VRVVRAGRHHLTGSFTAGQLLSQQTPSTQKPLTQSAPVVQVAPMIFFPQLPMTQAPPPAHGMELEQVL
jgi:hypothetical protein